MINLTFLQNDITNMNTDGLRTKNDVLNLTIPHGANFTICLVLSRVQGSVLQRRLNFEKTTIIRMSLLTK